MKNDKGRKICLLLAFCTATIIFYNSSLEKPYSNIESIGNLAIIYHFSAFFLFGSLLLLSGRVIDAKYVVAVVFLGLVYAAPDEMHQFFVSGRSTSLNDFLLDSLGIFASTLFVFARRL